MSIYKSKLFRNLFTHHVLSGSLMLLGILLAVVSCDRCELVHPSVTRVPFDVQFDYSQAGIIPGGTTIVFYPVGRSDENVSISTHSSSLSVSLPPGEYSVLVVNESFGDFSNIGFRNTAVYNQVEAHTRPVPDSHTSYEYPLNYSPDILAVDTLPSFTVKPGMDTQVFKPMRSTHTVRATVHISNMQYVRQASSAISGFSGGHVLSSRSNTASGVTHRIDNAKLTSNTGSKTQGTLAGTFNTFGLQPGNGTSYKLVFDALLIDGKTTVHKEFDVTHLMEISKDDYGLVVNIELGTADEPAIVIPKVNPEEGTPPFDPDVDDWEEGNDIDVPM